MSSSSVFADRFVRTRFDGGLGASSLILSRSDSHICVVGWLGLCVESLFMVGRSD